MKNPFAPTEPHARAKRKLRETELELQQSVEMAEYYVAMSQMLTQRAERLKRAIANFEMIAET